MREQKEREPENALKCLPVGTFNGERLSETFGSDNKSSSQPHPQYIQRNAGDIPQAQLHQIKRILRNIHDASARASIDEITSGRRVPGLLLHYLTEAEQVVGAATTVPPYLEIAKLETINPSGAKFLQEATVMLDLFAIHTHHTGKGYAAMLENALRQHLTIAGYKQILVVTKTDSSSSEFFTRLGYKMLNPGQAHSINTGNTTITMQMHAGHRWGYRQLG